MKVEDSKEYLADSLPGVRYLKQIQFLFLHTYLQMTLAMPISPAIGRTEPIAASRAVSF